MEPFKLERYFAKYEFSAPWLLSCSDCEALTLKELLGMADEEVLNLWDQLSLGYTETNGHPLLVKEIAKTYTQRKEEDILVLTPSEGIFLGMNLLLQSGEHMVVTFPGYQSLYETANHIGCELSKWKPESSGEFDIETLFKMVQPNTRMIVINFPHNPTGRTLSPEDLSSLVDFAESRGIYIFSDEMYRGLEYHESSRLPSVSDLYKRGISLSGVSKVYSLPGLRIGWLISGDSDFLNRARIYKDYTTICSSAPSEILAIAGLRQGKSIIKRNLGIIENNLLLIEKLHKKYEDIFSWQPPFGGTVAFPELRIEGKIEDFCQKLVDKKGAMLVPSSVFDYEGKNVRLGFGRVNFPEALGKLEEFLEEL